MRCGASSPDSRVCRSSRAAAEFSTRKQPRAPRQIGEELGAQYLLTGTVRWEKGREGQSHVRVSPELVHVSSASTQWQEPFDALLTDVFKVQAEVATQVALALGVALKTGEREQLAERPSPELGCLRCVPAGSRRSLQGRTHCRSGSSAP